jgi:glycine/D-amino acid oxidase-like deaminating enzyme
VKRACDTLIIGAGLAGSLLAYRLTRAGNSVLLVNDPAVKAASRAAAGLINPVTGQRLVLQANIEALLASALDLYRDIESRFNVKLLYPRDMLRVFRNEKEREAWENRKKESDYSPFIDHELCEFNGREAFVQHHTGNLDTNLLLDTLHGAFRHQKILIDAPVEYRDIHIEPTSVSWQAISADRIIFCEGWRGENNPWFSHLPFQPAKGEILTLTTSAPVPARIINHGKWLLPINGNRFKFGATYEWNELDETPTDKARDELLSVMAETFPSPGAEVIEHVAGVRPGTRDKHPFLGFCQEHSHIGIFNGFGSKGSLLIPWYAQRFASNVTTGTTLPSEADIGRFDG